MTYLRSFNQQTESNRKPTLTYGYRNPPNSDFYLLLGDMEGWRWLYDRL